MPGFSGQISLPYMYPYTCVCVRVCVCAGAWRMVYQEHKTPSVGATRHCSLHTPSAYAYKLLSA